MKKLIVDLGERSYPIYIDENLLKDEIVKPYLNKTQKLIVTNETLYKLYKPLILSLVDQKREQLLVLRDGEEYKNQESLFEILTRLLELQFNRQALLIAFGGGVIGDLVGFAASIYQRGIDFVQIPTSLLAQVDSSVGGKTAINHPLGKNMIGSFHQPQAVLIDTALLRTLPEREYRSGLAEVVKYGFIQDKEFLAWLLTNAHDILSLKMDVIQEMIYRSCDAKRIIVHLDERESGIRATLNLGHTFGHALERAYQYRDLLHGEAVAIGIVMAAELSLLRGYLNKQERDEVIAALRALQLPTLSDRLFSAAELIEIMRLDKKNRDHTIRFVLFERIGQAIIEEVTSLDQIEQAIKVGMPV